MYKLKKVMGFFMKLPRFDALEMRLFEELQTLNNTGCDPDIEFK